MEIGETIHEMHTRITLILNEMHSLREAIPSGKSIHKLLSMLQSSCESKVEEITEARELNILTMDDLIGNLITYELKKNQKSEIIGERNDRNLVVKATKKNNFEQQNMAS